MVLATDDSIVLAMVMVCVPTSQVYNSVYFNPTNESSSASTNERFKVHRQSTN